MDRFAAKLDKAFTKFVKKYSPTGAQGPGGVAPAGGQEEEQGEGLEGEEKEGQGENSTEVREQTPS